MIKARATIHGFDHPRITTDVDVLDLRPNGGGYTTIASRLRERGFVLAENTSLAYRFIREGDSKDVIDVMISQANEHRAPNTFLGRKLLVVPGGVRASMETELLLITRGGQESGRFQVPSVRGAMILKGAAYLVDHRDKTRHLEDGVMLLACVESVDGLSDGLSLRSRKRVRALLRGVAEHPEAWINHDQIVRGVARQRLEQLSVIFDLERSGHH